MLFYAYTGNDEKEKHTEKLDFFSKNSADHSKFWLLVLIFKWLDPDPRLKARAGSRGAN
jgi:hypothetical protein